MKKNDKDCIFLVDDEPIVLETIGDTLKENYIQVHCFTRAADCIEHLGRQKCDLLITDLKMPEMDGIELLTRAKQLLPWMPVLVITGFGDIPTAVTAIQNGAVGFIEKPLERKPFLLKVESLLQVDTKNSSQIKLSKAERKILELVKTGKSSRNIANLMHRSQRTIEYHRTNMMKKFNASNSVEMIEKAIMFGFLKLSNQQSFNNADEIEKPRHKD
jgi:two-component system, LuxR family, response regulator FixJ